MPKKRRLGEMLSRDPQFTVQATHALEEQQCMVRLSSYSPSNPFIKLFPPVRPRNKQTVKLREIVIKKKQDKKPKHLPSKKADTVSNMAKRRTGGREGQNFTTPGTASHRHIFVLREQRVEKKQGGEESKGHTKNRGGGGRARYGRRECDAYDYAIVLFWPSSQITTVARERRKWAASCSS